MLTDSLTLMYLSILSDLFESPRVYRPSVPRPPRILRKMFLGPCSRSNRVPLLTDVLQGHVLNLFCVRIEGLARV